MVSEGSLRGMCKRSLERLSKARSVAACVPREYRLIVGFVSGAIFLGKAEGIEKGKREGNWAGWKSLAGAGRGRGRRRRSRDVGKWEVRRGGTTSLCIFVDGEEEVEERQEIDFILFYLFVRNRRVPGSF